MKTYRIKFRLGTRHGVATVEAHDEIEAVHMAQIEIEQLKAET